MTESFDIYFKIVSNRNKEVYIRGYVTINDEKGEDVDWYYYNASGFPDTQMFIEHEGVKITGATDEQKNEVEQLRNDYFEDSGLIMPSCNLKKMKIELMSVKTVLSLLMRVKRWRVRVLTLIYFF